MFLTQLFDPLMNWFTPMLTHADAETLYKV